MATAAVAIVLPSTWLVACGEERSPFSHNRDQSFERDASADAPDCRFQCSRDGRSVIEACTGTVVETCRPELTCGAGVCQEPCAAAAAEQSSNGCEFYFQPPRFTKMFPQSCYAAFVVNTSNEPLEIALELEGRSLDISKAMFRTAPGSATLLPHVGAIPPGDSVILFVSDAAPGTEHPPLHRQYAITCPEGVVPASYADSTPSGTGTGSSFRLTTNVPAGLTAIYPFGGAPSQLPSATLLLPVASWAQQHVIVNGWEASQQHSALGPGAQLVASEDDTEVTILPTHDIQGGGGVAGQSAWLPATYRLGKGQHLQLVQREELSGSIVASNKPTTIFGGHACADVPTTGYHCDALLQQIPGFEQWGSEYVGVGYRPRLGNEHEAMPYRIVAARDGTRLDYDPEVPPGAPITLSAGEVATFQSGTGEAFVVRTQNADHPIYLAAYMTGGSGNSFDVPSYGDRGDPEFVNVVPAGQYMNAYSFYADPTYAETSLVVVRAKSSGEFKDVWLECAGNLTGWKPVGRRADYEFVRVDLSREHGPGDVFGTSTCQTGLQRMRSEGPFTATLWGWDKAASYAYTGGRAQRKLVETPLPLIR